MAKAQPTTTPAIAVTFHAADGTECRIDQSPHVMQLVFADGAVMYVFANELNQVANACMWHGAKQKLVDAAAISRDPATGWAASIEFKRECVDEVRTRMVAGQWFKVRGDGTSAGSGGLLYRAVCRFYEGKKTPDECRAWLDAMDDAAQQALRRNPRIAAIIEAIRPAPKTDGAFDADAALDSFGEE